MLIVLNLIVELSVYYIVCESHPFCLKNVCPSYG